MRSMVEGPLAYECPTTALSAVPLPIACGDREEKSRLDNLRFLLNF